MLIKLKVSEKIVPKNFMAVKINHEEKLKSVLIDRN